MSNTLGLYQKLMAVRNAIQRIDMKKGGRNEFAKYNYFELADFLPTAMQLFEQHKLCGIVSFGVDLATLTIIDYETGEKIEITSPMSTASLKGCHEVQNLGAVQTYIRRYLWVAALEIVEHDAIDSSEPIKEPEKAKPRAIYPAEDFQKNFPAWQGLIESGKKTAEDLIAMIETKGSLTKDQKAIIASISIKEAA